MTRTYETARRERGARGKRGRLDIASPLGVTWRLAQHVVEDEDHGGAGNTDQLLVQATNRFAE